MLSIFTMGLWPIFILSLFGAVFFGVKAYKSWVSGSVQQGVPGESSERVPLYKIGYAWYSGVCGLAAILFLIFAGK